MAQVFEIKMEVNLDEWTSAVTGGGDFSQSADATAQALAGTAGAGKYVIDDTGAIYGEKTFTPITTPQHRVRIYFDINTLSMTNNWHRIAEGRRTFTWKTQVDIQKSGATWQLRLVVRDDAGTAHEGTFFEISNDPHYFEWDLIFASSDVASDATAHIWVDKVLKYTHSGKDIFDTSKVDRYRFGATSGIDGTTSGTFYLDEIVMNDDGSEIGAVAAAGIPPRLINGGLINTGLINTGLIA